MVKVIFISNGVGWPKPNPTEEGAEMSLRRPLLELAQRNHKATLAVQVVASVSAVAMVSLAHGGVSVWYLYWLGAVLLVCAIRAAINPALERSLNSGEPPKDNELITPGILHCAGLIVSGALWALFACSRLGLENENARFVILITLSAMAAGATGVLAPLPVTGRTYITLMLLPASLTLILENSPQSLLGYVGIIFWAVMLVGHRTNHNLITQSLELSRNNADLVVELKARNDEILGINLSLERRVAERIADLQDNAIEARADSRLKAARLDALKRSVLGSAEQLLRVAKVIEASPQPQGEAHPELDLRTTAAGLLDAVAERPEHAPAEV